MTLAKCNGLIADDDWIDCSEICKKLLHEISVFNLSMKYALLATGHFNIWGHWLDKILKASALPLFLIKVTFLYFCMLAGGGPIIGSALISFGANLATVYAQLGGSMLHQTFPHNLIHIYHS